MLPKMNTTEEAIEFGKIATSHQLKEVKLQRKYYQIVYKNRPENASIEELNAYLQIAFKGQLMREALESSNTLN